MARRVAASLLAAAVVGTDAVSARRDDCECKHWYGAYKVAGSQCGQANEFAFITNRSNLMGVELSMVRDQYGAEICEHFFTRFAESSCLNVNVGNDYGQWCYVSPMCRELNGGSKVLGVDLAWKRCVHEEKSMRDFMPEKLGSLSHELDIDLGMLHKFSYPLYKAKLWKDVQWAWYGQGSAGPMPMKLHQEMKEIIASGRYYSFDTSIDGMPPHRIVKGLKVWSVAPVKESNEYKPGQWFRLSCISHCDE
mmetsp:Transcript_72805/g.165211  ORF Transcript_72805/g.165211 Transcript_72805/m.165211 type:complete len:250 (+) Transcript_72805:78-827(+)